MLIYSSLQHVDLASLTYHSFIWSAANFCKPKQSCLCHCFSSSHTPCLQSKGLFHFSFVPPSFFVSASSSVPPTHLESREQTNLAGSNNNKKSKEKGKESSVFLSGGSNQISFPFTGNQSEWQWLPRSHVLTNQPQQKQEEGLAFFPNTQATLSKNIKLVFNYVFFQHQASVKNIHFYKVRVDCPVFLFAFLRKGWGQTLLPEGGLTS